jgi:hypothetical protein
MEYEKGRFGNNFNLIHRMTKIEKEKISVEQKKFKRGI